MTTPTMRKAPPMLMRPGIIPTFTIWKDLVTLVLAMSPYANIGTAEGARGARGPGLPGV